MRRWLSRRFTWPSLLRQEDMIARMSRTTDCHDTRARESFFHRFTGRCSDGQSFQTPAQARSIGTESHPETFHSPLQESACLQTLDVFILGFGISIHSGEDQDTLTRRTGRSKKTSKSVKYDRRKTMPLNSYITLGNAGLRVSPFCLGTMTFGEDWGWGSSVADAQSILARYLERGGNFIDTANTYTKGHSEKIIGDFISSGRVRRDWVVLATKFFCNLYRGDPNGGGAGRKAIGAQGEQSPKRLQNEVNDLSLLHPRDQVPPPQETNRERSDLVAAR